MWVSQPELVAAVSEAGGLGILTALTFETAEGLADAIARTRALTDRPFGVNLTFLPTLIPKDYGSLIDVIVDEGIGIVETAGRNPEPYMERIKAGGAKVVHKCTSVRFAKKAEAIGCDYVSIDGCECAGPPRRRGHHLAGADPGDGRRDQYPYDRLRRFRRCPRVGRRAGPGRRSDEHGHPLRRHPGGPAHDQRQAVVCRRLRDRHHVRDALAPQHRAGAPQRDRRKGRRDGGAGRRYRRAGAAGEPARTASGCSRTARPMSA